MGAGMAIEHAIAAPAAAHRGAGWSGDAVVATLDDDLVSVEAGAATSRRAVLI